MSLRTMLMITTTKVVREQKMTTVCWLEKWSAWECKKSDPKAIPWNKEKEQMNFCYIFREINLCCGTVYGKDELLEVGGESICVDWRGEGVDQSLHGAISWKMGSEKVTRRKGLFSLFTSTFFLSFIFL